MDVLNVQHLKPFLRMRIYRKGNLYTKCIEQMMHSSFVVFYFVFVLWQFPDVSRGIVFYSNARWRQKQPLKISSTNSTCSRKIPKTDEPEPLIDA